jgi:hypothetical protein
MKKGLIFAVMLAGVLAVGFTQDEGTSWAINNVGARVLPTLNLHF